MKKSNCAFITAYERDNESDLDFAQARYFNSADGRFSSPDNFLKDTQKENPGSWNLYVYVRNNPLKFVDPTGEEIWVYVNGDINSERLQYRNNKLYTKDGKEYKGNDDYALKVLTDLNQLKDDDGYVGYVINTLENSEKEHNIYWNRNGGDSSNPSDPEKAHGGGETGTYISYNPYDNLIEPPLPVPHAKEVEGPARINLAHEIWHSFDTDQGRQVSSQRRVMPANEKGVGLNIKQGEIDAVRFENRVRSAISGTSMREQYGPRIPSELLTPSTPLNNTDANNVNISINHWKQQMSNRH